MKLTTAAAESDAAFQHRFEELALAAGRAVMDVFAASCAVKQKADLSPVTEADEISEAIILAGLRQSFPDVVCVAEEECSAVGMPASLPGTFLLIDPLDGTREFVNRRSDFTVNIALIRGGEPVVGAVLAPASRQLYTGRPGVAERIAVDEDWHIVGRERIRVRRAGSPLAIVASRSHRNAETDEYLLRFPAAELVSIGSSLKFCMIAAGEADLYPRFSRTMEWDTAAGDAVLRAAGGSTVTPDGLPLEYGKRGRHGQTDFANSAFIARGMAELS